MSDNAGVSRRTLLLVDGTTVILGAGAGAAADSLVGSSGPQLWQRADRSDAPRVSGLHLQYGADASTEVVVSWHTAVGVSNPRVMFGTPDGGFGDTVAADTVTYRDAQSGTEIRVHHARLRGLPPDTEYVYAGRARRCRSGVGYRAHRSARTSRVAFHQFRRLVHADPGRHGGRGLRQ